MTNAAHLLALAEQLAASHSGSWELDCAFLRIFGWECPHIGLQIEPSGKRRVEPEDFIFPTRSLGDALLFAAPPGHAVWSYTLKGGFYGDPTQALHRAEISVGHSRFTLYGDTAPLALCAAICKMLADPKIAPFHSVPPRQLG